MPVQCRALIQWSPEHVRHGLSNWLQAIDPAWLDSGEEGWSLEYCFDASPFQQGNPSVAFIRFVVPSAPHERLVPGATLLLFERATSRFATVTVSASETQSTEKASQ